MSILEMYKRIVPFLGAALGKDCEVVLHDLRYPDESVIAIANGDISSRKLGAPATDFILKLMQVGKKRDQEYMTNYYGKSVNGHTLRSSTFFIHDEEDNIIGGPLSELRCPALSGRAETTGCLYLDGPGEAYRRHASG